MVTHHETVWRRPLWRRADLCKLFRFRIVRLDHQRVTLERHGDASPIVAVIRDMTQHIAQRRKVVEPLHDSDFSRPLIARLRLRALLSP